MPSVYSREIKEKLKTEIEKNKETYKYESFYLKSIFPDLKLLFLSEKELYRYHFILMHHLYLLQQEWEQKEKYLHIHFMRIQLFEYPKNSCRFFHQDEMKFCNHFIDANSSSQFCKKHSIIQLDDISKKVFYLDCENIHFYEEIEATGFSRIAQKFVFQNKKVMASFSILNIKPTSDSSIIKKAFRKQAIQLHPDKKFGDAKKFKQLNTAYKFLEFITS